MFQSDLSDEEVEISPGVKVPADNIQQIQKKNEHRAFMRHTINLIRNLGGTIPEDTEQIASLLRRRSLRMLMEEKAAKTRVESQLPKLQRFAPRAGFKPIFKRRTAHRRAKPKCTKLREVDLRNSQPQLIKLQPVEPVQGERVKYQWIPKASQCTELQKIEPIKIKSQWTEFHRAQPRWFGLRQVQVEPQLAECVLLNPLQATPVFLNPVESAPPQYAEIQEVTEVRVVQKIRVYEETK